MMRSRVLLIDDIPGFDHFVFCDKGQAIHTLAIGFANSPLVKSREECLGTERYR